MSRLVEHPAPAVLVSEHWMKGGEAPELADAVVDACNERSILILFRGMRKAEVELIRQDLRAEVFLGCRCRDKHGVLIRSAYAGFAT